MCLAWCNISTSGSMRSYLDDLQDMMDSERSGMLTPIIRESRYPSWFLRRKNATSGTDGEREQASIRKARRSLVDPFTQKRQVTIESAIVERSQCHVDRRSIARNSAGKLEERKQTPPGGMSVRSGKVLVTRPCKFQSTREREMS